MSNAKCPKCGAQVTLAPAQTSFQCLGCGTKLSVRGGPAARPTPAAAVPPPPMMPAEEWSYVDAAGQQQGPVSERRIAELLQSGSISASSLVWKNGMAEWAQLSTTELGRLAYDSSEALTEPPPAEDDNVQNAQELGRKAYGKTKVAMGNAAEALKILFSDPMGGQGKALDILGQGKAMQAGIVFTAAFVAATYLLARSVLISPLSQLAGAFGHGGGVGLEVHIKWILVSLVPAAGFTGAFMAIGKMFGGRVSFHTSIFTTGVALLPLTVAILVALLVGVGNLEVVVLAAFFCICITILLLNASLVDVQKLSTRKAVFLTPTVILLAGYITKVIVAAAMGK